MFESFDLNTTECEEFLRAGLVGRVAACTPDGPHIVPVNYSVVDDAIVLRTTPYSLLGSQTRGAVMALEVDQFDYEYHRGWSVAGARPRRDGRGRRRAGTHPPDLEPDGLGRRWTHPLPAHPLDRAHGATAGPGVGPHGRAAGPPLGLTDPCPCRAGADAPPPHSGRGRSPNGPGTTTLPCDGPATDPEQREER